MTSFTRKSPTGYDTDRASQRTAHTTDHITATDFLSLLLACIIWTGGILVCVDGMAADLAGPVAENDHGR